MERKLCVCTSFSKYIFTICLLYELLFLSLYQKSQRETQQELLLWAHQLLDSMYLGKTLRQQEYVVGKLPHLMSDRKWGGEGMGKILAKTYLW